MEVNRIQIRLNPKKERDHKVIEKLRQTDKTQRDYVMEAILAYQERPVMEEDTFRKILREELQNSGFKKGLENAIPSMKKQERDPIDPERLLAMSEDPENGLMGEKAMGLLSAFDIMD